MAKTSNNSTSQDNSQAKDNSNLTAELARWTIVFAFGGISILGLCAIFVAAAPGFMYVFQKQGSVSDVKEGFSKWAWNGWPRSHRRRRPFSTPTCSHP